MSARLRFTLAAALFIPLLSGCVVFKGTPKGKQVDADTVRITFTICASAGTGTSCPDEGNSEDGADIGPNVILLGFRVPIGSRLPRELQPVSSDVSGKLRRARQYSRVLNDEAPTPVGFEWFGYRSGAKVTPDEAAAKFKVLVRLPRNFHQRRFRFRPVVGYFQPNDDRPDVDSPIVCGEALFARVSDDDGDRICIDSPSPDETARHLSIPLD